MKRHNFAGGAATHGSMFHRAPGGIGASSFPSRVIKGKRFPGHMGSDRVTTRNLKVVRSTPRTTSCCVRRRRAGRAGRLRGRPQGDRAEAEAHPAGGEAEGQEVVRGFTRGRS